MRQQAALTTVGRLTHSRRADKEAVMKRLPRLLLLAAAVLLVFTPSVPAQTPTLYQGPLFDGHSHPIPWVDPPLTVPAVAAMLTEVGTMGVFLGTMNMHVGGAEEGAKLARQYPNVIYPFLGISGFPGPNSAHWLQQDPVFIKEEMARIDKALESKLFVGIGEIFTQFGQIASISGPTFPADGPGMMALAAVAAKHNVILQVHHTVVPMGDEGKGPRLDDWERFVSKNPKTKILLAHGGFTPEWLSDTGPQGGPAKIREWLGKFPHLFVELSWATNSASFQRGLIRTAIPYNPKAVAPVTTDGKTLRPEWKRLFEDFPDRFVGYGSDPTFNFVLDGSRQVKTQREVIEVVKLGVQNVREILGQLPPAVAEQIAYKNALRLVGR
jgi:hypothetical protein